MWNLRNLFKKTQKEPKKAKRTFAASIPTRFTNWMSATLQKINGDINYGLLNVVPKCRDVAKNSPVIRSYLSMCTKNIIGKSGFTFQSQLKKGEGELNEELNDKIEWMWYEFGKTSNGYLTMDGQMGHNEFDALILRTMLIDGECFIRIHKNMKNPYGLSFEILDSMSVDWTKKREFDSFGHAIVLGVEVDRYYKPVAYYIRDGNTTQYQVGKIEQIPASEIIHLYRKEFPQQTRGIPPFNAILNDLHQLDDYRTSELLAAKAAACLAIFYERNSNSSSGDFIDEANGTDESGAFIQALEPGMASVTPDGYNVKTVAPTHPNGGFDGFTKAILKQLASSLGTSYNKMTKDYEATSFSSLKEASIDEAAFYSEMQQFLIDNWKEKELSLFLESIALNSDISPKELQNLRQNHAWICQKRAFVDRAKEIIGEKYSLEMGIKNPIEIIEEEGKDVDEVLKGWKLWKELCGKYDLNFTDGEQDAVLDPIENQSGEEIVNKDRK